MALNATTLSASIKANLTTAFGLPAGGFGEANMQKACDAIAQAVVAHITTFGVVNVASVSEVTAGAGTSGPGTGTIS